MAASTIQKSTYFLSAFLCSVSCIICATSHKVAGLIPSGCTVTLGSTKLLTKILMKKQRKMVFHRIKSKYPSLRKNQEGENRMVQGQQGEQCYLSRIISIFQNWMWGKRQGIESGYKMKVSNTWSISPRVCVHCCLSASTGTNSETAILMTINNG